MRPLDGITIVALEHVIAAPFATRQLADLGRALSRLSVLVLVTLPVIMMNGPRGCRRTLRGSIAPRRV